MGLRARRRTPPGPNRPFGDASAALDRLRQGAAEILKRDLTDSEAAKFGKYLDLLIKWGSSRRLIGSSTPGWIVENVFLDSLLFLGVLPAGPVSLVDIGSGAGVPGIPIRIVRPDLKTVLLVEGRRYRASFLSTVARELDLAGVTVLSDRLTEAPARWRGVIDVAVARCAGQSTAVKATAASFVRSGGALVMSGAPVRGEAGAHEAGAYTEVLVTVPSIRHTRRFLVFDPTPTG